MGASYPKPDDAKVTRHEPKFGWVSIPRSSGLVTPTLPPLREWSEETVRWWAELWSKGQATQWDASGSSAVPMAVLYEDLQRAAPEKSAGLLAEMRQQEDRHGLNPKAMLQLRWRVVDDEPTATPVTSAPKKNDRKGRVLRMVATGNAS